MKLLASNTKPNLTDNALLEQYLQTENLEVLGDLYGRHAEMVYYVCLRYFKDEEKCKDAVMLIFEQLIQKVHKQKINDFAKWLYVVTKNFCLMDIRSTKNKIEVPIDEFVEFSANLHQVNDYAEKEELLTKLERCIASLPVKQKEAVDLFFLQEKCYKEIVQITGFNNNEVKSFIQNGKRNLKICMERNNG